MQRNLDNDSLYSGPACDGNFPTLLCSRPNFADQGLKAQVRRPVPAALEIPEEPARGHARAFRIHNTFIDSSPLHSPSLDAFYSKREVSTCPSKCAGRLAGLFAEPPGLESPAGLFNEPPGLDSPAGVMPESPYGVNSPYNLQTPPYNTQTPLGDAAHNAESLASLGFPRLVHSGYVADPFNHVTVAHAEAASFNQVSQFNMSSMTAPGFGGVAVCAAAAPLDQMGFSTLMLGSASRRVVSIANALTSSSSFGQSSSMKKHESCSAHDQFGCTSMNTSHCDASGLQHGMLPPYLPSVFPTAPHIMPTELQIMHADEPLTRGDMWLQYTNAPPMFGFCDGLNSFPAPPQPPSPPSRPAPGSDELPSTGSGDHAIGRCKPCAFLHTRGCENGLACQFCHLCDPGEKKRRQKEKIERKRVAYKERHSESLVVPVVVAKRVSESKRRWRNDA